METRDRYQILLDALAIERKNEENYFNTLSKEKTILQKTQSGVLWQHAQITKKHFSIGDYLELEISRTRLHDYNHKFKTGVNVVISGFSDEGIELKATVSYVRRNTLRLMISSDDFHTEKIHLNSHCNLELIFDPRPYTVMNKALRSLMEAKEEHTLLLREGIRNKALPYNQLRTPAPFIATKGLNASQNEAIKKVSECTSLGIIHGPPGTGKTTTLVGLVSLLLKTEKQVLVCAPSNNAVDLLCLKLYEQGLNAVRLGNLTRVGDHISHLSVNEKLRNHKEWQNIKQVKIEAVNARKMAKKYKRKFGQTEKKERAALFKESKELRKWARDLEQRLLEKIIDEAQVICCTLIGSDHEILNQKRFNTLIIDEASQALEAESWVPMLKAKRVILAGDHKQLPPTVKSQAALDMGLGNTILERMNTIIEHSCLLDTQYRMNEKILSFSNNQFYDGLLKSDQSVKNHSLKSDQAIVVFIDTAGCGFEEAFNTEMRSYYNEGEAFILFEHLLLNKSILGSSSIGVISPYAEQVRFIRSEINNRIKIGDFNIEVDTVDGFQGQEKDVIYISLTRSNDEGKIGFLKDARRLNVALTRARKKLIIIGDSATLGPDNLYLELIQHIENNNTYQSAWEYMNT